MRVTRSFSRADYRPDRLPPLQPNIGLCRDSFGAKNDTNVELIGIAKFAVPFEAESCKAVTWPPYHWVSGVVKHPFG